MVYEPCQNHQQSILENWKILTKLVKKFDQNGIGTMSKSSTIDFRKLKNFDQFGKKIWPKWYKNHAKIIENNLKKILIFKKNDPEWPQNDPEIIWKLSQKFWPIW